MRVEILSTITGSGKTRFVYRAGNGPKRAFELPGEVAPSVAVEKIRAALGAAVAPPQAEPAPESEEEAEEVEESAPEETPEPERKTERVAASKTQKPRMQIKKKGR